MKDFIKNLENRKTTAKKNNQHISQKRNGQHTETTPKKVITSLESAKKNYGSNGNNSDGDDHRVLTKNDIIRKFDTKYKIDSEKDTKREEIVQKTENFRNYGHFSIEDNNCNEESPADESYGSEETSTSTSSPQQNDSAATTPPKPMPRTSRNNSLPDSSQSSVDEVVPRPRPRTNANTTYKVRVHKQLLRDVFVASLFLIVVHVIFCTLIFSL